MAKRRVNKNVVAFITIAGVLLAVIVVAIAAYNASRRDPAVIATKARAQEEVDPRRAIALYRSAFAESKDARYLLEAARVAREMGDLNTMFALLNGAYAQSPDDPAVLTALLERYWEIRDFAMGQWKDVRERAARLCAQPSEKDNLLGLASLAEALERLKYDEATNDDRMAIGEALEWLNLQDASLADLADQILARAAEIDPVDPYAALVRARQTQLRRDERIREAIERGRRSEVAGMLERAAAEQVAQLQPALEAHPDDVALRVACAQALAEGGQWAASRELLEVGIEHRADDPDLRQELARVCLREIRQRIEEAANEARASAPGESEEEVLALANEAARASVDQTMVAEGVRHANRAVELEPALYGVYMIRAELQQLGWMGDGSWTEDPGGRQKAILESYAVALSDTVGLESFRAMLARFRLERLQLISAGFESALSFHRGTDDEEVQSQALTYMRGFLQEAQIQYGEWAQTALMEGHVAVIDEDQRAAIRAFSRAEEQAERVGGSAIALARMAREELSKLYRAREELGLALEYTVRAIEDYRRMQELPPRYLYMQQVETLLGLDRAEEALDLVTATERLWPNWSPLKAARARALTALGRGEEAMRVMEGLPQDDPRYLSERARIATLNGDYDTATVLYGRILEARADDLATIDRLLRVLIAADRSDEARVFIRERLATTTNEQVRRLLQSFDLVLSESDPEARRQKHLEMIAGIPDEYERAHEYFNFWRVQGDFKRAMESLDEMERLRAGDPQVQRLQFELALRAGDCERCGRYVTSLAQADVDGMGGALFRGRYELHCGDANKALAELRGAEREFPRDPELKIHIGRALMRVVPPRYEEAIQVLSQAVQYDPQSIDGQKLLYACYEAVGRRDEGIPHLEQAVQLVARARVKDEYIEAHAQLLGEERDPAQGIENRRKLRQENPQDVANLLRLAELYEKVGDLESARECLEAAAEVEPTNSQMARLASRFFAKQGDKEAGERLLQKHLDAQEGFGEIVARALLGRFYEALYEGEVARARELGAAGEAREVVQERLEAADALLKQALSAYQQAQERANDALAGGSEQERRRAIVASTSELAEFYRRTRDWQAMLEACRVILDNLDPDDIASKQLVQLRVVSGLQALGRLGEARDEIATLRREYPDYLAGMMVEAELLIATGEYEPARELLSRVLAADPDNAWSLYTRARLDIRRQRYAEARDDLLRAKEVAPVAAGLDHRFELVRLYELMDKPELAEAELRELLSPELDRAGDPEVELRLIAFLKRTGQIEKAQAFVNELISRSPRQPLWPRELGRLLIEREEYSAAVSPLRTAAELTSYQSPAVVEELLKALIQARREREAVSVYESLPPRSLTPLIKTYGAEAFLAQDRRDIAVLLLEQALGEASLQGVQAVRAVPPRAQTLLGREEALALLRRVADSATGADAELALRLSLAEFLAGDPERAKRAEALTEADAVLSRVSPGTVLHLETLLTRALVLDLVGEPEQAVAVYEQALQLRETDIRALNNLAYLLADKMERPAEALPYARRLHELAPPDSATTLDTVGWVYFKNGDVAQALPVFLEAARIDPEHVAIRYHLGLVYADGGRRADAERELRRALELAREQQDTEYTGKAAEALEALR